MNKIIVIALALVSVVFAEGGLFVPHELPCAYTAEWKETNTFQGASSKHTGFQSVYGENFLALTYTDAGGHHHAQRNVFRPDIKDPSDPLKAGTFFFHDDDDKTTCLSGYYEEPYQTHLQSPVYDMLTKSFEYTWEEETTFDGKKCMSYSRFDNGANRTLYADFDGWVIAKYYERDEDNKNIAIITSFTNVSYLDDFYAPKSKDCEEFPDVFKAPPLIPGCDIPEHRPRSDAASHFTSLILLLMALVFLSF